MKAGVHVFFNLVLDCFDDFFVTMAHVGHANTAGEVDVFLPFHIRNQGSFGLLGKDGVSIEWALGNMLQSFRK